MVLIILGPPYKTTLRQALLVWHQVRKLFYRGGFDACTPLWDCKLLPELVDLSGEIFGHSVVLFQDFPIPPLLLSPPSGRVISALYALLLQRDVGPLMDVLRI